jgi:hypothetical protein
MTTTPPAAFEPTSKRRKGYPSEARVKRGVRVVHGDKELVEKLGRNDPCPCGSTRRFQAVLPAQRPPAMAVIGIIISGSDPGSGSRREPARFVGCAGARGTLTPCPLPQAGEGE